MGKKSRVKTQKSGTGATASVSPKETLNLTSELLQSKWCSWPSRLSVGHVLCPPAPPVLRGNMSGPLKHEVSRVTWAGCSTSHLAGCPPVEWSCRYLWAPCNERSLDDMLDVKLLWHRRPERGPPWAPSDSTSSTWFLIVWPQTSLTPRLPVFISVNKAHLGG